MCTTKGIRRQGIMLKVRTSLQESLCPVVRPRLGSGLAQSSLSYTIIETIVYNRDNTYINNYISIPIILCMHICIYTEREREIIDHIYIYIHIWVRDRRPTRSKDFESPRLETASKGTYVYDTYHCMYSCIIHILYYV